MRDEEFKKNVERWELFYPREAEKLRRLECQRIHFHTNPNGDQNLTTVVNDETLFLHSKENPREEAKEWFNSLDLTQVEVIIVYGVGLGYYYEAAADWLHRKNSHALVFIEEDLEVIHRLLETELGTALLHDKQVWLTYLNHDHSVLQSIASDFTLKPYVFSALGYNSKSSGQTLNELKSKYAFYLNIRRGVALEYNDHGRSFFNNFFTNMFSLPEAYFGNGLYGKFRGVPAIICGAGPSLGKNLHVLETLRDKALIFAGGTAMNALNSRGFLPHFGVGIDPNPAQFTRLIMNQAYEIPFFYRNRFLHDALEIIHGDHLYLTGTGGYDISQWFEKKLGIEGRSVSEGFNVVNFSVSIAQAMGCNPIILTGVDLAYTETKSYAPGVINHPLHERREFYRTKSTEEDVISHKDIYGQPTLTLWKWVSESLWFSNFAASNVGLVVVNSTEGGIGFTNIPNYPLEEVTGTLLRKQYDFDGLIWSEIQNTSLPSSVTEEAIVKAMEELRDSMKRSLEYCKIVRADFENTEKQLKEERTMPENILSDKAIEALGKLEEEEAYQSVLKVFSESYTDLFMREFHRLTYDENLLTDLEINSKRVGLNSARYKFLRETAKVILSLLEQTLQTHADDKMLSLLRAGQLKHSSVPSKQKDERYAYEDQLLEIRDPEMGIEIKETFIPDELTGTMRENYPSGEIKCQQYLLEGDLHGPSRYYSKEGTLVSETWFMKGLRQGKSHTYYSNGALHSIERFKEGLREGKQEYFYPDGQIKSSLNYSGGQLNGEVKLYFPSGQLKRELSFVHGKRKGYERIWNELGTLLIEAEFELDKPVGIARKWYPNGNMAKELVYGPDGSCLVREWNERGQASQEQSEPPDYFDRVSRQTDKLTEALQQVLTQVTTVAPLMEMAAFPERKADEIGTHLEEQFKQLRKEMEELQEINKKLAYEAGIDDANKEEAIWKGPSSRKEVEKQIDLMTKQMTNEMNNMQSALVQALGILSKKLAQIQAKAKEEAEKEAKEKKPKENSDEGK